MDRSFTRLGAADEERPILDTESFEFAHIPTQRRAFVSVRLSTGADFANEMRPRRRRQLKLVPWSRHRTGNRKWADCCFAIDRFYA